METTFCTWARMTQRRMNAAGGGLLGQLAARTPGGRRRRAMAITGMQFR